MQITEEWDGETLWEQKDLLAFAPELAAAEEMEMEHEEDCDCGECECEEPDEKEVEGKKMCAKCGKMAKSEVKIEIEVEKEEEDETEDEGECECESPEPMESEGKKSCAKCGKMIKSKNQSISTVITNTKPIMITSIAEINEEFLKTAQANELRDFLEKHVADCATKAADKIKSEKDAVEAEKAAVAAKLEAAEKELAEAKTQLDAINAEKALAAAQELFNKRFGYFDEKFELAKEDKEIIAKDLKELANDEAFASYQKKMDVLLKGKEKGKQAVASTVVNEEKVVKQALENATVIEATITAGSTPKDEPKSLYEKFKSAFEYNNKNYKF